MNSISFDLLLKRFVQNTDTSQEINHLANQLIKELSIQTGFGLAGFLEVDNQFDNFTAVRYWIQQQYAKIDTGEAEENYTIIKDKFLDCMPEIV